MQDDQWPTLLARLPADLDTSAFQSGALYRRRGIPNAATLLRLILAYACHLPLRAVVTWAAAHGLATISDEALDQRLRQAAAWLAHLLTQVLAARARLSTDIRLCLRLIDTTHVARFGCHGLDWRCHLTFDLQRLRWDAVTLTDYRQGDTFAHAAGAPHDLVIGDRGYAERASLLALAHRGAWVLVRLGLRSLPLATPEGTALPLLPLARPLAEGETREWAVQTRPPATCPALPGRLVITRLPAPQAQAAQVRTQRRQPAPAAATVEAAGYLMLLTTVPSPLVSTADIVALYRFRWQIELACKRLKSLMQFDRLTARHTALCRTVLLARLLVAVLTDDLGADTEAFFP